MRKLVGRGDRRTGQFAILDTDAGEETGLALAGAGETLVGNQLDERIGDIRQGLGGGAGVSARHVGHAVVNHALLHVGRLVVGGGTGGFRAASLVDGDVDEDAAGTHPLEHRAVDELGSLGPGDQHGANEKIDMRKKLIEVGLVGKEGVGGVHVS